MSEKPNDGGPAFPQQIPPGHYATGRAASSGMSRRDLFAGQAMMGLLAYPGHPGEEKQTFGNVVDTSVLYADALIAELDKDA